MTKFEIAFIRSMFVDDNYVRSSFCKEGSQGGIIRFIRIFNRYIWPLNVKYFVNVVIKQIPVSCGIYYITGLESDPCISVLFLPCCVSGWDTLVQFQG